MRYEVRWPWAGHELNTFEGEKWKYIFCKNWAKYNKDQSILDLASNGL